MKNRVQKKIEKSALSRCYVCGCRRMHHFHNREYRCVDYYVGEVGFICDYIKCKTCGNEVVSLDTYVENIDKMRRIKAEKVLFDYYPIETNEYLLREEAEKLCENTNKLNWLDFHVFNSMHNGKRLYLKKSFDKYMRCFTGFFKLVPNELEEDQIDGY